MRKALFWFGWIILGILPVALGIEIFMADDLPHIQPWKWAILLGAVLLIYFARNRDSVLVHHVV